MLNFNDFQTLNTFAEAYFHLGYSVIPLLGDHDPARPKVPAIAWAAYQTRRPSLSDFQHWFTPDGFAGIGIVTGGISQLVVLDFDTEIAFQTFKLQYPDLLETHTVRSAGRQLPHLYYRLPSHLHLPSQKGQGIDLLSDGRYVVAPPTTIQGQTYQVTRGGMPKTLTERDLRRLQAFLAAYKSAQGTRPVTQPAPPPVMNTIPTAADLHALYRHLMTVHGRNEALFRASTFARNHHVPRQQTQDALIDFHAQNKTPAENIQQRTHEALKTIQSAYSRPPQAPMKTSAHQHGRVSNSVREALLQRKMTYVLRTFEGLLQSGMSPGQSFTAAEAVKQLRGIVGRDSVLKALAASASQHDFFRAPPPVSPPNTANAIAHSHLEKQSKKCILIAGKNQEKKKKGRTPHRYTLPDNKRMSHLLGVAETRADALTQTDLVSARNTRLALHRELIKRRAGSYSKRWMAARLGVSRRTIFTYNQLAAVHSRPLFLESAIRWQTIGRLPPDTPLQGAYLQTLRGKKYPALRQIAARLLSVGEAITLKQQTINYYWYGDDLPSPVVWSEQAHQQAERQQKVEQFIAQHTPGKPSQMPKQRPTPEPRAKRAKPASARNYQQPFTNPAQEALAMRLYDTLNQIKGSEFQKLSRASARWLAASHAETSLRDALARVAARAQGGTLRNPVGFFITLVQHPAR